MSGLDGKKGLVRVGALLTTFFCLAGPPAATDTGVPVVGRERLPLNVRFADEARAEVVRRAVLGAHDALGGSRCREIFSAFRDASGRPLQQTLDTLGVTGQGYLGLVLFYDGSELPACRTTGDRTVFAATTPGSRAVRVCGARFARELRMRPVEGAAVIIHETLHSLGLGENPPTSEAITWRVMERCGY